MCSCPVTQQRQTPPGQLTLVKLAYKCPSDGVVGLQLNTSSALRVTARYAKYCASKKTPTMDDSRSLMLFFLTPAHPGHTALKSHRSSDAAAMRTLALA